MNHDKHQQISLHKLAFNARRVVGVALLVASCISQAQIIDRIVAVVENKAITQQELEENILLTKTMLAQKNVQNIDEKKLVAEVLQQLITKNLQLQEAQRLNIQIDAIAIDRAVAQMAQQNNMDLVQLQSRIQQEGRSFEKFREQIGEHLATQQLLQREVVNKIKVSEEEIQQYLLSKSQVTQQGTEYHLARWQAPIVGDDAQKLYQKTALLLKNTLNKENISSFDHLAYRAKVLWKDAWVQYFKKHRPGETKIPLPKQSFEDLSWKKIVDFSSMQQKLILDTKLKTATRLMKEKNTYSWLFVLGIRNTEHSSTEKQYRVRHILLQTNPLNDDEVVRKRLEKIKDIAQRKNNFDELAKKYSKDPGSSFKGGDLGWSNLKSFVPEFRTASLEAADTGKLVGPFKTAFGWHLLEVTQTRENDIGGQMARSEASAQIRRNKLAEAKSLWLINLREKSHIEIFL
ncbi:MAG: peptidylprolyl isomerase [Candidatus Oxydemutatoraceae bacterium WSBS_2016_MAG_OTU14]